MKKYAIIFLIFISCSNIDDLSNNQKHVEKPSQESWNAKIFVNSEGRRAITAESEYLATYNATQLTTLIGNVKLDFFDDRGNHTSVIFADTGKITNNHNRLFTALGNVVIEADSGIEVRTDELFFNEQLDKLYTNKFVRIATEGDTLYGVGFESDASLEHWILKEPKGVTYREENNE
jgi:LPS export ABC transporter protein LptC